MKQSELLPVALVSKDGLVQIQSSVKSTNDPRTEDSLENI